MMTPPTMLVRARRAVDDPDAALERNRSEDILLVQRINAAAGAMHRLWSSGVLTNADEQLKRRHSLAALQAEIDRLYEQRRQLVARRGLLKEAQAGGKRMTEWGQLAA